MRCSRRVRRGGPHASPARRRCRDRARRLRRTGGPRGFVLADRCREERAPGRGALLRADRAARRSARGARSLRDRVPGEGRVALGRRLELGLHLRREPAAGVRCVFTLRPELRTLAGAAIDAPHRLRVLDGGTGGARDRAVVGQDRRGPALRGEARRAGREGLDRAPRVRARRGTARPDRAPRGRGDERDAVLRTLDWDAQTRAISCSRRASDSRPKRSSC
jgi:hypothetical protein